MSHQIGIRVSEGLNDRIEAVASDNNCSKSEAVRQLVKHGLDNADIAAENRRLKEQLAATNQRIDANNQLVEYVEEERDMRRSRRALAERRAKAGLWTRTKWWLWGMDDDENDG